VGGFLVVLLGEKMGKGSQLEEEEQELNGQYSTDRALLHVIILPYPARGHSIPLLHFAKHLHSLGVTVTYVNVFNHLSKDVFDTVDINATEEEEEEEKVDQDHSNRNRSKSRRRSIRVVQLGVPPVQTKAVKNLPYVREVDTLVEATEEMMEKLFAENQAAPPACLVSDMFLGWTQASKKALSTIHSPTRITPIHTP
jgi:hydroquinone glucosyltransferase